MNRVTTLAAAAEIADPSPELILIAGLIIHLTKGKPKEVARMVQGMRDFAAAHVEMAGVARLRGAEYDARVITAMAQGTAWLDRLEPFLLMMSKR